MSAQKNSIIICMRLAQSGSKKWTTSLETIKPLYATDTNALFWYLTEDKKLTQNALAIFEAAERAETQIVVSAIVLAELYYLDKKWKVFENFTKVYHQLEDRPEFLF